MNRKKLKAFEEAPVLCIFIANGHRYPFMFSNERDENARINDRRFHEVYKHGFFCPFFLWEDTFAERKAEYMKKLEDLVAHWVDFYHYMPHVEYNEFVCSLLCFCKKYSRVFGLRDYTGEMLKKLNLMYMMSKHEALRAMDIATPWLG